MSERPTRPEGPGGLPAWAAASAERRAHIERVAGLVRQWADEMGVAEPERARWVRAAWLHDALRDAPLESDIAHGPAAAERAAQDGESDRGVLDAVRYHTLGYAGWDDVGRMLYLADYLDPGRTDETRERNALARRVPRERDQVLREVAARRIGWALGAGRPLHPLTVAFWNSLASR